MQDCFFNLALTCSGRISDPNAFYTAAHSTVIPYATLHGLHGSPGLLKGNIVGNECFSSRNCRDTLQQKNAQRLDEPQSLIHVSL